ncbi:protease-4 [Halobiforma haloterrestris]|uniref:Protease-4 n=1 Tax=Natronobacterium haloterrestre TaxID=148448 RepID=A0A1I1E4D3_NATHA|nr:S49 family peptidase [Halobiforma haloterrestris]SFB82031.1 protease-4 [Halobiforma haloterrestris]
MSGYLDAVRNLLGTIARSYVTIVLIALLVGAAVAPVAWGATSEPDGTVAVIEMDSSITERSAEAVTDDLREARQNESIDAVVLAVDSPGGGVTASESLYLAVERTAQEMPVVTSIQSVGASGGYYMSAPSDEIYVNPSSTVGSIGVRATHIDSSSPDREITTGPDKSGMTREQVKQRAEKMKQTFIGSVVEHRGDELELSETELAYANVYIGVEAVDNGLADEIGDTDVAIGAAAEQAGLNDYEVVELSDDRTLGLPILFEGGEDGEPVVVDEPHDHPQTFGDYGGVETPAFLAVWGSVEGESGTVVDTAESDAATQIGDEDGDADTNGGERP